MENRKPTFFDSVASGIRGYIKGFLAGGISGIVAGAAVGAVVGAITIALGAQVAGLTGLAAIGSAALTGATTVGTLFAGIGALSGSVTGVVKSREAANVQGQDIVNIANMAFAQGVSVGHDMTVANPAKGAAESSYFRELVAKKQAEQSAEKSR